MSASRRRVWQTHLLCTEYEVLSASYAELAANCQKVGPQLPHQHPPSAEPNGVRAGISMTS